MGNAAGAMDLLQGKEVKAAPVVTMSPKQAAPEKLPVPPDSELEERFNQVLNSMNLPPDKMTLLRQYDNDKKWELICDQDRFQVKNPPSAYIQKLKGYLDSGVASRKFKRRFVESTQVLRELETSLRTNHIGWVQEFLNAENRGLDVLVEYLSFAQCSVMYDMDATDNGALSTEKSKPLGRSLEDLSKSNSLSPSHVTSRVKQLTVRFNTVSRKTLRNSRVVSQKDDVHVCIMCLRAIMNYQSGFSLVMNHPSCVNEITLSLNNKSARTKALVLDLLAAVCLVRGGHDIIMAAFDNFKEACGEKHRFEKLMDFFRNEDSNIDFMVACMQFINIVVHSVENMNFRVFLQYEFTYLGLDEYLEKLKYTESDKLLVQIQAYLDNIFDVGSLLEDTETKNAMLEHMEDLQEQIMQLTERLQEADNEYMGKIAELEKQLSQARKELDTMKESFYGSNTRVTLQLQTVEDEPMRRPPSAIEQSLEELEHKGLIRPRRESDNDPDSQGLPPTSATTEQITVVMIDAPSASSTDGPLPPPSPPPSFDTPGASPPIIHRLASLDIPPAPPLPAFGISQTDSSTQPAPFSLPVQPAQTAKPAPVQTPLAPPAPPLPGKDIPPPPGPPGSVLAPPPPPPPPPPPFGQGPNCPAPPPPPPPGMMSGFSMGSTTADRTDVRIKQPIQTKFRMPLLNWVALKPTQINGTVFTELNDEKVLKELNMNEFEDQFKTKVQGPTTHMKAMKVKSTQKPVSKVNLIEINRAKNLAITLRKGGLNSEDICKAIQMYDMQSLNLDFLELLIRFIPTEYEQITINKYLKEQKPIDDLSDEDRFMIQFSKIPRLTERLNVMTFLGNFSDTAHLLMPQLNAIIAASMSIKSSTKLRQILEIVLAFGNYMNSSKRGAAYGFRLQSLDVLLETKSTDRKQTLLHYIVKVIEEKYPELKAFHTELHFLDKAGAVSLESVLSAVKGLQRGMELTAKEFMKQDDSLVLKDFLKNNQDLLDRLVADSKTAQEAYDSTVEYFGENGKTTPPSMFFPMFIRFVTAYKKAEQDIELIRKQEAAARAAESNPQTKQAPEAPKSPAQKAKRQHGDLMAELKKKQQGCGRVSEPQMYEGGDGAIEDIITDLRNQPYRRTDPSRRSARKRSNGQTLQTTSDISL